MYGGPERIRTSDLELDKPTARDAWRDDVKAVGIVSFLIEALE